MPWLLIVGLAVGGVVGWKILSGGIGEAKFVVTVRGEGIEGVSIRGRVPGYDNVDVAEFIAGLDLPTGAKVWGVPDRGRLMLRFSKVPDNLQQRMRNFFLLKL